MPFRWLSPLNGTNQHAGWTDVFVALSAVVWAYELRRHEARARVQLRPWQLALLGYLLMGVLSAMLVAPHSSTSWSTILLMVELGVLAFLTSQFAQELSARRAIVRVIAATSLLTIGLAALGLILFYARIKTGLIGPYGEQYIASSSYARVQAGFESPPLLASYCIFASAILARADGDLPPRLRIALQLGLGLVCAATLSRGLIGFAVAIVLRWLWPRRTTRSRALAVVTVIAAVSVIGALTVGRLHLDPTRPSTISYIVPDPGNRREAFVTSLHTFEHHPLLGLGPGTLPGLNAGQPFRAHFTPLNVAATLGAPALLMLIAMFWFLWRGRRRPTDLAAWTGLVGLGIDALAQDADHFRHVWVLVGLAGI